VTVVLVAAEHSDGDLAHHQKWIDVLEARGQVVFLVAPSAAPLRAERHVATRADTADTLRAMAEAVTGVAAPVLLVDAGSVGSPITVEEMVESTGTRVLARGLADEAGGENQAPLRVVSGVVVAAGSAVHSVREPTHVASGLLRVQAVDAAAVGDAFRVMADVVETKQWGGSPIALGLVAVVRSGLVVRLGSVGSLPWGAGSEAELKAIDESEERQIRLASAMGEGRGPVDRWLFDPAARALCRLCWRVGIGASSLTVLALTTAVLCGLSLSVGSTIGNVLAAVLLLLSAVLDRADGALARCLRTTSGLGTWADATASRVRAGAVVIGLALGSSSNGSPRWALATLCLALLATSEIAVDSGGIASGHVANPLPARLPLDRVDEPAGTEVKPGERTRLWGWWLDIGAGEGALLTAVAIVALDPAVLLVVLAVIGALVAIVSPVLVGNVRPERSAQQALYELGDPGLLARLVDRQDPQLSVLRRALTTPLAAWLPPMTWVIEAAAVLVAASIDNDALAISLAWIAVVAFHRLDIGTQLTKLGTPPPAWVGVISLGSLGRAILVLVFAAVGVLTTALAVGAVVLGVVFASESAMRFADSGR